jgi:ATP-dependent DNA helicase RecG
MKAGLTDLIGTVFRIDTTQEKALEKLGIFTVGDLLYHFPTRYQLLSESKRIIELTPDEPVVIHGKIHSLSLGKTWKSKTAKAEAILEDDSGTLRLIWFHQPYLAKMLKEGELVRVEGKVTERKGERSIVNPRIDSIPELPAPSTSLFGKDTQKNFSFPVYAESKGITSRWFYYTISKLLTTEFLESLTDPIPEDILKRYSLPSLATALVWIHTPQKESDSLVARKRFAFEEIFYIQLGKQQDRARYEQAPAFAFEKTRSELNQFIDRFPFKATHAQQKAIDAILSDFKSGKPMSRLLEGDVGSGKTAVAATTAYAAVTSRPYGQNFGTLQVAYMAPTEILATQHFESFIHYFNHLPIQIALITGSGCKKFPSKVHPGGATDISRTQLLKWVASGEISILIGTHALIQKSVTFKHLAYIIIDEQHRFGTAQRQKLTKKSSTKKTPLPHLLSMTATPIPRTLALTIYGDLDLTLLDEMPAGRKPIETQIIPPNKRAAIYEHVRDLLKAGRQAYVICPRIDEPDPDKELALEAKSVKAEAKRLAEKVFPEFTVDILHSKMKPADKDEVMEDFKNHKTDILVATSVVEVGVNVPNATTIIIEGAERFGLSQLHQLRGRVIRSNHQAYCYLFAEAKNEKTMERLKALVTAKNGFELSELDLKLRGAGELYGKKQWGVSDIGMEAVKNIKMVEAARTEATKLITRDPELNTFPLLKTATEKRKTDLHFE